jgi:hypothetical protein
MTDDQSFLSTWEKMGTVALAALRIVESDPAELLAILATARRGIGTEGERSLVAVLATMRTAAVAQVELAEKALEIVEKAAAYADKAAMAALSAGPAH